MKFNRLEEENWLITPEINTTISSSNNKTTQVTTTAALQN